MTDTPPPADWDDPRLAACACTPETLQVLSTPVRRQVVAELLREGALSVEDVAAAVGDGDTLPAGDEVTAVALHHVHLPKLRAAGLVSTGADRVALRSHPDVRDGPLSPALLAGVAPQVWAALAALARDPIRPRILVALETTDGSMPVEDLVGRLTASSSAADRSRSAVELDVRHSHLPMLESAGLLERDPATGHVSYDGDQWFCLSNLLGAVSVGAAPGREADSVPSD
jgi:DNA-binding transcriptional ArsR family regulator